MTSDNLSTSFAAERAREWQEILRRDGANVSDAEAQARNARAYQLAWMHLSDCIGAWPQEKEIFG